MPNYDQLPKISLADAHDQFVLNTIKALGVTQDKWIANYYRLKKAEVTASLKRLKKQERVLTVAVEGWESSGYIHPDNLTRVESATAGKIPRSKTTLLSPFDPLIWDRGRTIEAFNFDPKIEFYFPESKRQYGYFSLPILYNNALIGRLDPKTHRKKGIFEVKSFHLEPDVIIDDEMIAKIKRTIQDCADWHETPQVTFSEGIDPEYIELLSD